MNQIIKILVQDINSGKENFVSQRNTNNMYP